MAKLSEVLPSELLNTRQFNKIEVGTVLRMMSNTRPPKVKFFVVIGTHENNIALGTVYINSNINTTVNYSAYLQALHHQITPDDYDFLSHNSYIDCSGIYERDLSEILQAVNYDNKRIVGYLNTTDLDLVKRNLIQSNTIKGKIKRRFGLYT